jgi:hypothetical protein
MLSIRFGLEADLSNVVLMISLAFYAGSIAPKSLVAQVELHAGFPRSLGAQAPCKDLDHIEL